MSSAPLGPLRLGWREDRQALWYLALLYRRASHFAEVFKQDPRSQQLKNSLFLFLHALPYMVTLSLLGRMVATHSLPTLSSATDIAVGIAFGIAIVTTLLRAYYQPLYFWMAWPTPRPGLYRFHPVAWDDLCRLPFPGLDRLLLAYAGCNAEAGRREIERLITSYPSQRTAALRAQVGADRA